MVNSAFVFIKPHAVNEATKVMVQEGLKAAGLVITSEGSLSAEEIDSKKLIDQHYYAIASKATILKPAQLNVPGDLFAAQFGLSWEAALAQGNVYNAMDACALLGLTADEMDKQWGVCKKAKKLVKFGGGFYCGLVEIEGKPSLYVFNGFFMSMRSKFTAPGVSIYYFEIRERAQEILDRSSRPHGEKFRTVSLIQPGYHRGDVDSLLDDIAQYFQQQQLLSVAAVRTASFRTSLAGYDERQVDALLDDTIAVMLAVR
jgi:DivIVA domain-containing protein